MKQQFKGADPNVNLPHATLCRAWPWLVLAGALICGTSLHAQTETNDIRILELQGKVEVMPAGAQTWVLTQTNQVLHPGDRLRTGENSRLTLKWSDNSVVPIAALTEMEILAPEDSSSLSGLNLIKGILSFFHRDKPGRIKILTHGATASIEGTEFLMKVSGDDPGHQQVTLAVVDGKVQFSNALGSLPLTNNQEAVIEPGQAPKPTAGFIANNLMQWCFYYPGVLNLDELSLSKDERDALQTSLAAYRTGNLPGALADYPASRSPGSDSEKLYHAALLLSVGQVEKTELELNSISSDSTLRPLAESLRTLITAVKRQSSPLISNPRLSTELMAASYYEQSRARGEESLKAALEFARRATTVDPQFGFAWERVAELEFGFGRTREAETDLDRSLSLSPRNAEALALKGFLLAAQNRIAPAITWFDRAIAADAALGNAWLGRGLCLIRTGNAAAGRSDLLIAAALEPQRSVLRSYLGKAFSDAGETVLANKEISRAIELDPSDPTGWLYSALLKQQENRINQAIGDLDESQSLNDNRSLFRSQMLLDQDKAVRSANLASLYRDAGMSDVGIREAARAVTYDYANSSAHLFLSDSYNELRDPTRFNLREETVWFNELLLANLLAPVGAGRLSQTLTSQEYSKLFESDGIELANQSSWRSDNQYQQLASQYGTYKDTSWALDLDYQHNSGVRPNNALNSIEWYTTIKQQLTPSDSLMLLTKYEDYSSGDNFQYYNPSASYRPNYKFDENQKPILIGGFHHEWAPGIQTLLLGGRLVNEQNFSDVQAPQLLLIEDVLGAVTGTDTQPFDVRLNDKLEIYTAELNQIIQKDRFTLVAGTLWQGGRFDFSDSLTNSPLPPSFLPPSAASFSAPFERVSGYGYLTVEPVDKLWLTGGFGYDQMTYPDNFRTLPQSPGTDERHLLEPKAAIVWSPLEQATVRGIYSRSLGGVSLDESYRLEPTQLAGFAQSFRTVISESIVGSVSAPATEVMGLALDLKFGHGTFAGVQFERIQSDVRQTVGAFRLVDGLSPFVPSSTRQNLNYDEKDLSVSINQLLPDGFVIGASYQLTLADLGMSYPEVAVVAPDNQSSDLHQLGAYLLFNHPSGLFARFDAHGYIQQNRGYTPTEPGDDFAQLDIQGGWRFLHRRAELRLGILNLTGQDYRLNPLTFYSELPRSRVFMARLTFQF